MLETIDTEILTENGFKLFKDIRPDEKICVYDKDKNVYKFEVPKKWYSYYVKNEDVYHIYSNETDQIISKNHRCLVDRNGKLEFIFTENLNNEEYFPIPKSFIFNGDVLDVLKALPDESVDMCITSPPYYGLRDYGTAKWVGGDPNCDHIDKIPSTTWKSNKEKQKEMSIKLFGGQYKHICKKCGAIRIDKQIGLEETPEEYVEKLVEVFREVRRVLKEDGTLWLNIGDSYAGSNMTGRNDIDRKVQYAKGYLDATLNKRKTKLSPKNLFGIPWRVAFALQEDGWILRQDIIWHKPNPMPESVKDRCTKAHEYIFLFSKNKKYYFDYKSIREKASSVHKGDTVGGKKYKDIHKRTGYYSGGYRNKRSVWTITTKPFKEAHFATFPPKLVETCILAGCPESGVVLDPFFGAGTTGVVAIQQNKNYIGIELNEKYCEMANKRINDKMQLVKAKVEKIKYSGLIFYPITSTGVFVARRNDKVFIIGNSKFPKSLNIGKKVDLIQGTLF